MQVVYLDNLDFGSSSTRYDIIPRVKDFSFDKLDKLINADKKKVRGSGVPRFGARQVIIELWFGQGILFLLQKYTVAHFVSIEATR